MHWEVLLTLGTDSRVAMYISMDNVESSSHLFPENGRNQTVERCFKSFFELSSTVEPLQTLIYSQVLLESPPYRRGGML